MTAEQKQRIKDIDTQIAILQAEKLSINPYANLKSMSGKSFGEGWSEPYIRSKTPNLKKNNGAGHDAKGKHFNHIEIKSSTITFNGEWTENQMHPDKADAYLFVWYNCEEGTEEICLIPTTDLVAKCRLNRQHGDGCFSMGSTRQNRTALKNYMLSSFDELNERV